MRVINITENEVIHFIMTGNIQNILSTNSTSRDILETFGYSPNYVSQKKNNPEIIGYGGLNIYLFNQKVTGFSLNFLKNYANNLFIQDLNFQLIKSLLLDNKIIFSEIQSNNEYEMDYLVINNKKLGFSNGKLLYISLGI